jgi:hypothetical protein
VLKRDVPCTRMNQALQRFNQLEGSDQTQSSGIIIWIFLFDAQITPNKLLTFFPLS